MKKRKTMPETVKDRICVFLEYINISRTEFERRLGVSHGYLRNMRKSVSRQMRSRIALQFPELNTDWMLTGRGEMIRSCFGKDAVSETERSRYMEMIAWRNERIAELEKQVCELTELLRRSKEETQVAER